MKKKGLIALGLGVGAGILLLSLSGKKDDTPRSMNQLADQQGKIATYPPAQYKIWADALYESLKSYVLGYFRDDTEQVINIFKKIKNDKDLAELADAFGTREFGLTSAFGFSDKKTLAQVLSSEVGTKNLQAINQALNSNGVTYQYS